MATIPESLRHRL